MAVSMTEAAIKRVRVLCKKRQTPDAVLRVGVRGGFAQNRPRGPPPRERLRVRQARR